VSVEASPEVRGRVNDVEAQGGAENRSRPWLGGLFDFQMGFLGGHSTTSRTEERVEE
jgi:hypothetical protein